LGAPAAFQRAAREYAEEYAKLALAAQPQGKQQPVKFDAKEFMRGFEWSKWSDHRYIYLVNCAFAEGQKSVASPAPQPQGAQHPLTDEQVFADEEIMECNAHIGAWMNQLMRLVRAIERAHGIGDQA
jgi:hypothetical protein